jgi:cytosine/uracil/thiamine/allantoin permease
MVIKHLRAGLNEFSVRHFLIALVLLLSATPFVVELEWGKTLEAVLLSVVLLTAVPAVGGRRRSLMLASLLVVPALVLTWLHHAQPDFVSRDVAIVPAVAFAIFVVLQLLTFIMRAERVNSEVLCAAVATYLMLGLVWAMAYELVWVVAPDSFIINPTPDGERTINGFEALYFSFGTLAPISDNDIVPRSNLARLLVMIEAIVGMLFMGMLIARLVGIYSGEEAAERAEHEDK